MEVLEQIWEDYKKIIIIAGIIIVILIIGAIMFSALYDPIKISFTGEDSEIIAMQSNEIKIGAIATDKKNDKFELSWQVSAGTLNAEKGNEVIWALPDEEGTYAIAVKAGNKVKQKNVTIIKNQLGELSLQSNNEIEYIDNDNDGLSNSYEDTTSKSDINNKDTDNDIVNDGDEVVLKLDPSNKESGSNGEQDDEIENVYKLSANDINVEVKGKDNIASSTIDIYDLNTIKDISAVISKVYNVKTVGTLSNAKISIKYDKNIVAQRSLKEDQLAIYRLDIENNKFIKLASTVDVANSTVSSNVTELGKFFVADSSNMKDKISTELMFVIDNSGSMYSSDMVDGSEENDTQFRRVDLSNSIIDKLKGDYKFGAGKFTFEYDELIGMTSDKEKVKEKINSIKTLTEKFTGTYIGNALAGGLKQFDEKTLDTRKYMILLTDGKDTADVNGYDEKKIASATLAAKSKNVKVFTIGLGKEIDSEVLKNISSQTGGKYYYASSSEVLEDVFELIAADINYDLVDLDKDSTDDYIILKNSNFLAKQNGMPIENFSTTTNNYGATYGMSLFSKLYFENKLPGKMSAISVKNTDTNEMQKVAGYDIKVSKDSSEFLLSDYELEDLDFMKSMPKDFMSNTVTNSVLTISNEYKKLLNSYGFSYYYLDSQNSNSGFKKYENYIVNNDFVEDENSKTKSELEEGDKNFVNAIYRLDILKYRDERMSLEKDPDKTFEYICNLLENKQVPIVVLNDSYTVAAQKLLVDINDSNHFKLEVYDSNYGGKQQYIDITRTKIFNNLEGNNSNNYQYKCSYNDKKVSVSVSIPNIDVNL